MDFRYGLLVSSVCTLLFSASAATQDRQYYVMATGTPGTNPYVVGVAIESLVNMKLGPEAGVGLNALVNDSFTENLWAMSDGRSQFAIADGVTVDAAINSKGAFKDAGFDRELKAVAVLWQEVDHFVVADDLALSGTIADLAALNSGKVATDPGNYDASRALLTAFGKQLGDEALPVFDLPEQLSAFSSGEVDAMAITDLAQSDRIAEIVGTLERPAQFLEFTGRQTAQLGQGWNHHLITANTYASLDHDIDTVARSIMLLSDATVDEEVVYEITKVMFENLPFMEAIHEKTGLTTVDNALIGITLELHPGAARFYQEIGLLPSYSLDPTDALVLPASEREQTTAALTEATATAASSDSESDRPETEAQLDQDSLPTLTLDETMLARSRAEFHDGAEVLKIDRPEDVDNPGAKIHKVYFQIGKTEPEADGAADVEALGQDILELYRSSNSIPEIYVEGHTDRTGDWKVNYEIAYRRALTTKGILVSTGVPDDWVHLSDHSEQKLAVATEDGVGDWRNRRVEVIVIPK